LTRTWLFGEAEYESSETFEENYARLFKTAEACGYMIEKEVGRLFRVIVVDGSDLEHVRITFLNHTDELSKITKWQYTDRSGEMELINKEEINVNR
jgi:hypothetical protein